MLPHVRGRPVSLQRFNGGIHGEGFFQKDLQRSAPEWVRRVRVAKKGGTVCHALADDAATLVWLAGQNAVTPHVWTSRADRLDRPDRIVWDLDPARDDFGLVRRTALELGELLRQAGCEPFAMTTGSRGVHVVVPVRRRHTFEAARDAALAVATELVARRPDDLTTEFYKRKRGDRLFVDVNRNGWAMTAVPPYAVRPRDGAPVATPLRWDELEDPQLRADRWGLRTVLGRLEALGGDPWAGIGQAAGRLPA
jgi:bifunctional non-homologous end joining protein LigD